jgi:serine protease Do
MKKSFSYGKTALLIFILCGCGGIGVSTAGVPERAPGQPGLVDKYGGCVFTVHAYLKASSAKAGGKSAKKRRNVGTAFLLDSQGLLVTLNCVVRDAEKIVITGNRGETYSASVIGNDEAGRITVLKIKTHFLFSPPPIKPVLTVKPGGKVFFLGIPPGKSLASTSGVVHSVHETDGAIIVTVNGDPGTSGTPVFDENGQTIGLLAYHLCEKESTIGGKTLPMDSYMVFPMEYASLVARSIILNSDVRGGWLGISIAVKNLFVKNVVRESPADRSGIKPGDTIVQFNGETINSTEDLVGAMSSTHSGDTIQLKVLRDGEPRAFSVKLSDHPLVK